ncbi:Methyltransferase domain-containing protein [Anaerovibrio lipolyticus DSM 3074]|uniref:Methyltransferase domain-containing protein n=2 Tax=Anaerovibrio lipolyticus TaxID=82374 RepID=A0A1M6FF90_9FIRM|nr:Methyltransferase domain-containing protein [Anaerovibrio lipolyticus DSM 3074]
MLHKIESGLFRLGLISDDYIMRRNLIEDVDLEYDAVREHWDDDAIKVHGDTSPEVLEKYANNIANVMKLTQEDVLLCVGCGDGQVDSYLQDKVGALYGFDFAPSKVDAARKNNPKGHYFIQSFLEKYLCPAGGERINKIYSSSVAQYCKPEDLHWFIELQVVFLKENGGGVIGHLDVPDRAKAKCYYNRFSEATIHKYQDKLRQIFADGSYWHSMELFISIGKRLGLEVIIQDAQCNYRSDVLLYLK